MYVVEFIVRSKIRNPGHHRGCVRTGLLQPPRRSGCLKFECPGILNKHYPSGLMPTVQSRNTAHGTAQDAMMFGVLRRIKTLYPVP